MRHVVLIPSTPAHLAISLLCLLTLSAIPQPADLAVRSGQRSLLSNGDRGGDKHSPPLISEKSFTYKACLLLCFNSILIDPYLSFQGLQYHMNGAQGWVPLIIVFHGHKGH